MSSFQYETITSEPAAVDLSALTGSNSQYCGVVLNSSGLVGLPPTAGMFIDGVLQNPDAVMGAQARFAWVGLLEVKLGGTVAAGANLAVTTAGTFVTAVTGNSIMAKAKFAGVAGDIAKVQYCFRGVSP